MPNSTIAYLLGDRKLCEPCGQRFGGERFHNARGTCYYCGRRLGPPVLLDPVGAYLAAHDAYLQAKEGK